MSKIKIKGKLVPLPFGYEVIGPQETMEAFKAACGNTVVSVILSNGSELTGSYDRIKNDLNKVWGDAVAVKFFFHLKDTYSGPDTDMNDVADGPITDWRQMNVDQLNEIYLNHPLYPIFMDAIHQAVFGKGQRHGGGETPFLDQPIFHYARLHGTGFLTGQAAKKTEEAASTRLDDREAFETEILGAMVYLGASVINERAKNIGDEDESID